MARIPPPPPKPADVPNRRARRSALGAALLALSGAARAQALADEASPAPQQVLVRGAAPADVAPPPYAGGQVARGARAGVLGDGDMMRTPFALTPYTGALVADTQARNVADVLQQDPGVRVARGFGNFQESYFIRGFVLESDDIAWNGLYGLLPRQTIAAVLFDRVEVLHGASAFLDGAAPGGDAIGGAISLTPKRAADAPLAAFETGGASGSQRLVQGDVARRFGADGSTGLRLAASRREGGTGVDRENVDTTAAMLDADWRSRDVRLSLDVGHQDNRLQRTRTNVTLATTAGVVPLAPDAHRNWAQPWTFSNERDTFGAARAEVDLGASATAWFAAGARRGDESNSFANLTVTNGASGAATAYRFDNTREDDVATGELGVRAALRTGAVNHALVLSASAFVVEKKNAFGFSHVGGLATNLDAPTDDAEPALVTFGNTLADPKKTASTRLASVAVADTLSWLDDTVLLTIGARRQRFDVRAWAYNTGVEATPYEASRTSPVLAGVLRVSRQVSVYANAIESLAQGDTAPSTAANLGAQLAPYVSKQREVGIKVDGGQLGGSAAFFSTRRPRAALDGDNVFVVQGADRHEGLELTLFGQATPVLRVLGGVTLLDATQHGTGSAATDGQRVIGVPDVQGSVDLDWRVAAVRGLSADMRVVVTGRVYADAANTLGVPGWTRVDLGGRYALQALGRDLVLRARVDNVAGKSYWFSAGGTPGSGYLVLGNPRTFTASAELSF